MSSAKQMTPLGFKTTQNPKGDYQGDMSNGPQGRDCKPKPGQPPKSSMYQDLFGGKKPA